MNKMRKFIFMMIITSMVIMTVGCKEESRRTDEDPNDGFVTINESWNDGWGSTITEQVIIENIITEKTVVEWGDNCQTWD